jgi:ABC-2 type transport system ATP-binding protein
LCDRIAILDEGRIKAVGTLNELLGVVGLGEVIELRGAALAYGGRAFEGLPEVVRVEHDEGVVRLYVPSAARALALIASVLQEAGDQIESVEVYRVSLERVFMHLTGKALRD